MLAMAKYSFKEKKLFWQFRKTKDPDLFGEIYDLYVDSIYRFVYFKVSSREEAQDLTSEVFLKAWQYLAGPLRPPRFGEASQGSSEAGEAEKINNIRAFLYQIARNTVIDFYRKRSQKNVTYINSMAPEEAERIEDKSINILEKVKLDSKIEEIKKALEGIKDEYREILILRFIEEMGVGEIADILGKSKNNVRVLIFRALKATKEIMMVDRDFNNVE